MTDTYRPHTGPGTPATGWNPPPPGPWMPPQYGYQPQAQASNGLAVGGFVTALIGAVLALVPFFGIVAWAICPIGLVISAVGLAQSRRRGAGQGMATAGVVLGAVGLVICTLWLVAFLGASSGASSSSPSYSSTLNT